MLGYVHKDMGQPHFKNLGHNINADEIAQGVADWSAAKLSYEDGKIPITKSNFILRVWTFAETHCPDQELSFMDVVLRMLNSKKYVVTAPMLLHSNNLNLVGCTVQWKLIHGQSITKAEAEIMLFPPRFGAPRPGAAVPGKRYFDKSASTSATSSRAHSPAPSIQCTEGALAHPNPDGPCPRADPSRFCSMTNALYNRRSADNTDNTDNNNAEASGSRDYDARAIRPDSPVSMDSGEHDSDADFINDHDEQSEHDSEPFEPEVSSF